jgi:hypothetical protein
VRLARLDDGGTATVGGTAAVRWWAAALAAVGAAVVHLVLHLGPFVTQKGWTLSSFRDYYYYDQLSYLAIARNWSLGERADVEPFTRTGNSPYPDLHYRVLGWLSDVTGLDPVAMWTVLGSVLQAVLVVAVGMTTVAVTRRWWTALLAPLPFLVGTFASLTQGDWKTTLDSHAVLWGPFGVLFTNNGESAALCLAGVALLLLVLVAVGRPASPRARLALVLVAALLVGVTGQIQTYTFLCTVFVIAYAAASYGVAASGRPVVWAAVSVVGVALVWLAGPVVADSSPLAALALGMVPTVPGLVLLAYRLGWWRVLLPWVLAGAAAAPQLLETVLGVASGDPFLVYREASSSNLGVPALVGVRSGAAVIAAAALVVGVGVARRSVVRAALPVGMLLAWAMGATNDRWGANQEPYRFWLDTMVLLCVALMPLLVESVLVSVRYARRAGPARGRLLAGSGAVVVVAVLAVSTLDFAAFRADVQDRRPLNFYDDRSAALARAAEASSGGVVLTDPCVDPLTLKIVWGGPVAFYNLGLAWPEHEEEFRAVLGARTEGVLDIGAAKAAGITEVLVDPSCEADWTTDLAAEGARKVAQESADEQTTYVLWHLDPQE